MNIDVVNNDSELIGTVQVPDALWMTQESAMRALANAKGLTLDVPGYTQITGRAVSLQDFQAWISNNAQFQGDYDTASKFPAGRPAFGVNEHPQFGAQYNPAFGAQFNPAFKTGVRPLGDWGSTSRQYFRVGAS